MFAGERGMADSNKDPDSIGIKARSFSAETKGLSVILDMG